MADQAAAEKADEKPLEQRVVVSCFIFKYSEGDVSASQDPQVALFRRSAKVHTYQHRLAPIAGSIEPTDRSPLAAAWREIGEETTLTPASLSLVLKGKPYSFGDESVGRRWTVNPFAFRLRSPVGQHEQQIQTDWEHEAWDWHDPHSVRDDGGGDEFGGVPRLAESLRRVYPAIEMGKKAAGVLMAGLAELQGDHQSGARQLATKALQLWRDAVADANYDGLSYATWWRHARMAAWHVWKNGRESMGAAVLSALLAAIKAAEENIKQLPQDLDPGRLRESMLETVDQQLSRRGFDTAASISEALSQFVKNNFSGRQSSGAPLRVLTLSESSTVTQGLKNLVQQARFQLDLRVLESRPLFEGASLAGKLVESLGSARASRDARGHDPKEEETEEEEEDDDDDDGKKGENRKSVQIALWTDASAALAAADIDLVIIGADRISSEGDVSNKTGSLPTILSAKHVVPEAKVLVLSESEKVAPPENSRQHLVEDNHPQQLYRAWGAAYNSDSVQAAAKLLGRSAGGNEPGSDSASSKGLTIWARNVFFEWVPASLIDVYITEHGQWTTGDISKHAKSLADEEDRLFRDI